MSAVADRGRVADPMTVAGSAGASRAVVVATLVRHGCLEFVRHRWLPMTVLAAALAIGIGHFASALALTEASQLRLAIALPLLRLLGAGIVAVLVIGSFAREATDRSRQLALAAPIGRPAWLAARFLAGGCLAIATALVLALAAALAAWPVLSATGATVGTVAADGSAAGPGTLAATAVGPALAAWSLTLACELVIVAAVAAMVVLALGQPAPSLMATAAIYIGGRLIGVILALDARAAPTGDTPTFDALTSAVLHAVAAVLPRLDQFARTDWLLGLAPPAIGWPVLQTAVYVALAFAVALIDLRRQDA